MIGKNKPSPKGTVTKKTGAAKAAAAKTVTKKTATPKATPTKKTTISKAKTPGKSPVKKEITRKTTEKKAAPSKKVPPARTANGRVPQGRTLTTRDKFLDKKAKEPEKKRPVVVIEANDRNDLAVVQLTTSEGKDRTQLEHYQQGKSRFKHYVEIADDEGNPIRVNQKFQENHPELDVSRKDVERIKKKVLTKSRPAAENRKKMDKFRSKKE